MFKFLGKKIQDLFQGRTLDEEAIEQLEEIFYQSDLGSELSSQLTEKVRALYKKKAQVTSEEILKEIKQDLLDEMIQLPSPGSMATIPPHVILIVGVNGNGKTTSVAKLAYYLQ